MTHTHIREELCGDPLLSPPRGQQAYDILISHISVTVWAKSQQNNDSVNGVSRLQMTV